MALVQAPLLLVLLPQHQQQRLALVLALNAGATNSLSTSGSTSEPSLRVVRSTSAP